MSVIRTDRWLTAQHRPVKLCRKLTPYFQETVSSDHIHQHLSLHGMYRKPLKDNDNFIKSLQKRDIWRIVGQEEKQLREAWDGPTVPIFILPADPGNCKLRHELNGKSGLSFPDKVFLFVSEHNTKDEIRALFTHEYNHVCRLAKYNKQETDYLLLDTVVLEGLAENAVRERLGSYYNADWTSYYSKKRLEHICKHLILPNRNVPKSSPKHEQILYGLGPLPNMAGYGAGYYLVHQYMIANDLSSQDLLTIKPEDIIHKTDDAT
ncbi:hypothetical protein GCM10028778_01720 [Barrientosiimonas marina]|uniref:DUF2268 domain-containing protein n=1 Tax=Lentibacillus kimchii TaxID=1542911 RepID=A0ABW2USI4_9BACI